MKELIAGIVLILVVGLGGFLYRNMLERNMVPQPEVAACTLDAKVCPDGSSVGRVAPSCEFAACPGEETGLAAFGIALTPPEGYGENPGALGDPTLIAAFEKDAGTPPPHAIVVRRFAIPEGETGEAVMLQNTMLEPSGLTPEPADFTTETLGAHTFRTIVIERFEGHVHSAYYVIRENDVLKFEMLERNVSDWTDPGLSINDLPEHAAFRQMLAGLSLN